MDECLECWTRLGGVQESDHDFPLNSSNVSLLALGILHQSAQSALDPRGAAGGAHWKAYVDMLPREARPCTTLFLSPTSVILSPYHRFINVLSLTTSNSSHKKCLS